MRGLLARFLHAPIHVSCFALFAANSFWLCAGRLASQTSRSTQYLCPVVVLLLLLHQMHLHHQLIAAVTLYLLLCSSTAAGWSLSWSRSSTTEQQPRPKGQHGQIASLPGYAGDLPSKHYSGYISVGSRQLFYYAVESERMPAEDPVV